MKKHIGAPIYEDFKRQISLLMDPTFYEWIGSFWKGDRQRKSGSIIACNYRLEVKSETEFLDALITEVTILSKSGPSRGSVSAVKLTPCSSRSRESRAAVGLARGR